MKFWEDSDRAMEGFDIQLCMRFASEVLNLGQEVKAKDVHSFVCRLREFSIGVRLRPSPVETRDRPLNANAKVFTQRRGTKEPKDGKSRLESSTRKGEVREIHEYKRKLSMMQAQVKEI